MNNKPLGEGFNRQPSLPDQPSHMELSKQERELIIKLRLLDFFRFNHMRTMVLEWNGARIKCLDTNQV